jgi:hypothetical protein
MWLAIMIAGSLLNLTAPAWLIAGHRGSARRRAASRTS